MAKFDVRSLPAIWTRELIIFKRYWPGTTFTAVLEPLIFLFAIGLGVGAFVDEIDGMKYVVFVGTGAVATAVLFSSVFPGMYNTFIARVFQKVYDGILSTPTTTAELMVGEATWVAARTAVYGSVPMLATIPFGLTPRWTMLLVPPICFISALGLTFLGQYISGLVKVIDSFSYFQSALLTPLLFVSGTYFPIDGLPAWFGTISNVNPVYHCIELVRDACLGMLSLASLWHVLALVLFAAITGTLSVRVMTKRLIT
jgi:lipooligosaccharide transport system permease protein